MEKKGTVEGIELPNQESIRMHVEKENHKYVGILESDTIKQAELKEYHRIMTKLLETKFCSRNLIKEMNT